MKIIIGRTVFMSVLVLVVAMFFSSCKKCYTCTNTCVSCTFTSGGNVLDTKKLCSDSTDYSSEKWSLEQAGYVCSAQPSTYSTEFCLYNKSEEERYMEYYEGAGRYTCKAK